MNQDYLDSLIPKRSELLENLRKKLKKFYK